MWDEGRRLVKNRALEVEQFRRRALFGFGLVALALAGLLLWYFRLQVAQHEAWAAQSEANRIKPRPIVPGRGIIYDRKGRILADNIPAFRLDVMPDEAGDLDAMLAGIQRIVALTPEELEAFAEARKTTRRHRPVTLKLRLSEEEIARFAVDRWRFPGVELVPYFGRVYPYGDLFAHVVGYVGRIDARDRERLPERVAAFSHTGKTGLERYYEERLRGAIGHERIETSSDGRAMRTLGVVPATPGTDLRLSIDVDLQRAMVAAFGELEGTAVAVDPRNGEILAMVSLPSYDPNLFVNGISHTDYKALNENPSRPQFNRAVLGGVAPGSTIKPMMALAGLDSGARRPGDKTLSTGMFYVGGQRRGYADSHRGGHGWTDVYKSIYASVNTYYYKLALDMGIDKVDHYMALYGFGKPTGVDLSGEIGGILPSPAWKAKNAPKQGRWYPGDTVITSIGQGFWKATPLQLAQATAALGNGGWLRRPHLAKETRHGFDGPWMKVDEGAPVRISPNPAHLEAVREGMILTVHGPGTATNIRYGLDYEIASKTGTAQVVSRRGHAATNPKNLPMHLRHRALFIAFAPARAPTIAVAVAVEGGGYGASTAAPIARKILDAWIRGKLPEGVTPEPAGGADTMNTAPPPATGGATPPGTASP
ncbi:penicillin-binding protein 2 [Lysobacter pythonis]|uniref:Peptidoglycan D,D-transpeptidase MrdA n=1 Tax=Solilutibacter pythonis TaxID=2483112 RepID=A0A3M2HKK5_9GAMM|nr:penicillin-binding protein 2 [Lysobacter pythonis]